MRATSQPRYRTGLRFGSTAGSSSYTLHGAHVEVQASGVKVHGSSEAPKSRKSAPEQHFYNPEQDEPGPGGSQMAPVPTPDPELTEELDASATPEDDEASE